MKTIYFLVLIFSAAVFGFHSCSADSPAPDGWIGSENTYNYSKTPQAWEEFSKQKAPNYSRSKRAWLKLKKENGNSYSYTVEESSWTGAGNTTTLVIRQGKVVSRDYESYIISENDGTKKVILTYSETGGEVGAHPEGAAPLTMDELYRICISRYLAVKPGANYIYFDTNEEGLISLCGYVPKNCADDCYKGILIVDFSWIK